MQHRNLYYTIESAKFGPECAVDLYRLTHHKLLLARCMSIPYSICIANGKHSNYCHLPKQPLNPLFNHAAADEIDNYVAVRPGKIDNRYMHSEQRIFEGYLKDIWKKYQEKHNGKAPKAMVLYSWIVPCIKQLCASKGTWSKGCILNTQQKP